MILLQQLFSASLFVTVAVDLAVLCYVLAAFERTKHKSLLLLGIICVVGIIDAVWDHTIALQPGIGNGYVLSHSFRRISYLIDTVLWGIGTIWLVRAYLDKITSTKPTVIHEDL
ncbi:MAG TPA: hypothetical protein VH595_17200 [Verrucomicrobiae bacterium]|jgi:hypothetical protein|nr:hypothetical protein [Verrucomicrobiae bacterium]